MERLLRRNKLNDRKNRFLFCPTCKVVEHSNCNYHCSYRQVTSDEVKFKGYVEIIMPHDQYQYPQALLHYCKECGDNFFARIQEQQTLAYRHLINNSLSEKLKRTFSPWKKPKQ